MLSFVNTNTPIHQSLLISIHLLSEFHYFLNLNKMNVPDKSVSQDMSDFRIFRTVFYYCLIIIALPVLTFFGSKFFIFDGIFGLANIPSNVYSAISAISVLHVALGFYIYRAYSDAKPSIGKQD